MASEQNHHYPGGGHYSGLNRIPNIKEFVAGLDKDKKDRDAKIDAQSKTNRNSDGTQPHTNEANNEYKGNGRVVTDPVTGNQVTIDDVNNDFMKTVNEGCVSCLTNSFFAALNKFN